MARQKLKGGKSFLEQSEFTTRISGEINYGVLKIREDKLEKRLKIEMFDSTLQQKQLFQGR